MVHAYTRDRDELLEALERLSPALPLKLTGGFYRERLLQSITALREIAFRNEGLTGRKNVLWLGNGAGVDLADLTVGCEKLKWFSQTPPMPWSTVESASSSSSLDRPQPASGSSISTRGTLSA